MSAPSFSSFPPSFGSFPAPEAGPSSRPVTPSDSRKNEEKRHRGRKDKGKKGKRDRHADKLGDKASVKSGQAIEGFRDDEHAKAEEDRKQRDDDATRVSSATSQALYFTDRKGDPLNVTYGGLHAGSVPKYHVVARGKQVLGLPKGWTVVHWSGKGIEIGVGGRRKMPSLTDSNSRAVLQSAPTRRLLASTADNYKYEEVEGFLRLSSGKRRQDDQSYRSIARQSVNPDSDSSASSDSEAEEDHSSDEDSDTTPLTAVQIKLKELEHEISTNPSSVSAWFSLLSYSLLNVPITSKNATKARSEIALSILSRALSAHPNNRASTRLRLKYIKAGEELWHESKLRAEWEDALKVTGTAEIWIEWLDWRVRRVETGIDGIVQDARRVLDALQNDEIGQLRAMWRVAVAFRQAGYPEKAMALFQAEAELTFEIPQSLYGLPLDHQLDALEELWEAEVPRLGEKEAKGWASWLASGRPDHSSSSVSIEHLPRSLDSDPYRRWAVEESRGDAQNFIPSRSTDEEEDPYATILFSDVRPLLCGLTSFEAKNVFRMMWISFLGLHIPGFSASLSAKPSENLDDRWADIYLTDPYHLNAIFPSDINKKLITADSYAGVLIGQERQYSTEFGPVKNWGYSVVGPLEIPLKDDANVYGAIWGKQDIAAIDVNIVRRVFEGCRVGGVDGEDAEWDTMALAFESAVSMKNAIKLSRSFLSTARDSISHWASHARLERLRGRVGDARKIYQTVLTGPAVHPRRSGTSRLWWDWVEMEWLAGDENASLQVILRSVEVDGTEGIAILRAKRALEENIDSIKDERQRTEQVGWIRLRALLELLTSTPAGAIGVFDKSLSGEGAPVAGVLAHESLIIASLMMLYHHGFTLRNPTSPGLLRDRVHTALEMYPNNTLILRLFLEVEKGQSVWGRVRGLLAEDDRDWKEKDLGRRITDVWISVGWEKGKWEEEKERTRSGLSFAIQSDRTRGSAILWRVCIEFEIQAGDLQRAKNLLFRAVRECPLVKGLYLLAFGPLRSAFNPGELNGFAETMAERGIRMRKGLDETLDGWREANDESMETEEEEYRDNEIEHRAKELRRLMPYH